MKKVMRLVVGTFVLTILVRAIVVLPSLTLPVFAEQTGLSPESGSTSKLDSIYDSLVALSFGSDATGAWGNWGAKWNRIRSAAEWVPNGNANTSDVVNTKTFYSNSRTIQSGTLLFSGNATASDVLTGRTFYSDSSSLQHGTGSMLMDFSSQSKIAWDDTKNADSIDGDNAGEEASWTNTVGSAEAGVWKDNRTNLYWTASQGSFSNAFTTTTCDFFSTTPRGNYSGSDADCGSAINACASLSLEAVTGNGVQTDWYLPTQKELLQAYNDGMYNTNAVFATTSRYWASTEFTYVTTEAWTVPVSHGYALSSAKTNSNLVRCVRRD